MAFEITVHETTGKTAADDLAGALKAAEAREAYEQVMRGEKPSGFAVELRGQAEAGVDAAVSVLKDGLEGGATAKYRVSVHGDGLHLNIHTQRLAS